MSLKKRKNEDTSSISDPLNSSAEILDQLKKVLNICLLDANTKALDSNVTNSAVFENLYKITDDIKTINQSVSSVSSSAESTKQDLVCLNTQLNTLNIKVSESMIKISKLELTLNNFINLILKKTEPSNNKPKSETSAVKK